MSNISNMWELANIFKCYIGNRESLHIDRTNQINRSNYKRHKRDKCDKLDNGQNGFYPH